MPIRRSAIFSLLLTTVSILVCLALAEAMLRIQNSSMTNYDIEMWRYASELKSRSDDPALAFDHVRSRSALLQNVTIRLNEYGLRGGPIEPLTPGERRILFLGGSITLGCSNLLNTFQIVNEVGTNNTTYYAIQGRKYTVTYNISF